MERKDWQLKRGHLSEIWAKRDAEIERATTGRE